MKAHKAQMLIEILTEELPAIPFLKEWQNTPQKWQNIIKSHHINNADFRFYFTPRRICIYSKNFPLQTDEVVNEFFGPPLEIAYNNGKSENGLSKAGESFLKKVNLDIRDLQTILKGDKEVLYAKTTTSGVLTATIIDEIVLEFLQSLHFGKSMRWGSLSESFIRPIRNILILLNDKPIKTTYFGQQGRSATLLHRDKSRVWVNIPNVDSYFEILKNGGVILDYQERKDLIITQIQHIQNQENVKVELDSGLLDEVAAITEYPHALLGGFDEGFLELPNEVIITSMKENQRYFAVFKDDKLYNGFVVVANSMCKDFSHIISGNERVLKARLSDAMFFYNNDLKSTLPSENLAQIAFVDNLGNMLDKTKREQAIGKYLAQKYDTDSEIINKAIDLSKVDLLSEMVGEFPELQGIMGSYYTFAKTNNATLAKAIKEQYLPTGENSALPSSIEGAIVAMSAKLDNLLGLFSIDKIPSGSKDPFALRRAANGIIRIILEFGLKFDLDSDLRTLSYAYKEFDLKILQDFLLERLESNLKVPALIFRSVCMGNSKEITQIQKNTKALESLLSRPDKEELISLFKRVANITKDALDSTVNENLLQAPQEIDLYRAFEKIKQDSQNLNDPKILLERLFSLKQVLGAFFDNVMVNAPDCAIAQNRKALIFAIYLEFKKVGDLKELAI